MKPIKVGARPSMIKYDNNIVSTTSPCSKTRTWGAVDHHPWTNKRTSPGGPEDKIKRPRWDLSRIGHTIQKIKQSGDSSSYKFQNKQQNINHFTLFQDSCLGGCGPS